MSNSTEIRIGETRFNTQSRDLRDKSGRRIKLRNKPSEVLAYLAERPGEVALKAEIMAAVWPEVTVTDESLTQCIAEIRRAIDDQDQTLLSTHVGKGYSLTAAPVAHSIGTRRPQLLAGVLALVVIAGFAVWALWPKPDDGSAPRIAILAFDDLSAGEDNGYLSDGIAEGVITELARYKAIAVIARNSSFQFRGSSLGIEEIADQLHTDWVVEGSKQKSGDRLRVTVQLINGHDGTHIWAEEYNRDIGELFDVQTEIVQSIARNIGRSIRNTPPSGGGREAVSALHYYLKGEVAKKKKTREARLEARDLYEKAIAADPNSAFGYIGMAQFHWFDTMWDYTKVPRRDKIQLATEAAEKALKIDPENWYAHVVRADIHVQVGEMEEAVIRYRNAHELNPSSATTMVAMTDALVMQGHVDEALELIHRALSLDPIYPDWYDWQLGWVLWAAKDCDGGVAAMKRMSTIPANAQRVFAILNACAGNIDEARAAMDKFLVTNPQRTIEDEKPGINEMWQRLPDQAERWFEHLRLAGMPDK